MYQQRGLLDRLFGICVSFFVATVLIYFGVQILLSVWAYIVIVISIGAVIALAVAAIRWRRERW